MGLLSAQQDAEVMAEINITPFTDVLLVLLIIFMILASLVAPPGFEKELAKSSNAQNQNQQNNKDINVLVNDKGQIMVDTIHADSKSIYYAMHLIVQKKGLHHVAITGDAKAPYGVIIRILDAAKEAGRKDVGFVSS